MYNSMEIKAYIYIFGFINWRMNPFKKEAEALSPSLRVTDEV